MFISDMGAILRPTHGLGVASNAPFRDGAPSLYEGGIRVPAIFRWPGKIKAGTLTEMLSQLDILPLCLTAAGIQPPDDRVLDGRNPLPALAGTAKSPHERLVFTYRTASALREGNRKILRSSATAVWELYDLSADPAESKDLASDCPADVARLDAAYQTWLADVRQDATPSAPRP